MAVTEKNLTAIDAENLPAVIYSVTEEKLAQMAAESAGITTADGAQNYAAVRRAIRPLVSARTSIEKERKKKKAGVLAAGRKIDSEAKRLTEIIAAEEGRLVALKAGVDEAERQRKAQERAAIKSRIAAIADADEETCNAISPDDFHPFAEEAAYAIQSRLLQLVREKKAREAQQLAEVERKALEAERAELEKQRQAEAAKRAAEDAERARLQKIEDDKRAKIEAAARAERERIAAEQRAESEKLAAERAKIEAARRAIEQEKQREKMQREAKERAEREHAEKLAQQQAEKKRAAMLRPDCEKITAFCDALQAIQPPQVTDKTAQQFIEHWLIELAEIIRSMRAMEFEK